MGLAGLILWSQTAPVVTYTLDPPIGSVDAKGVYTKPAFIASPTTVILRGASPLGTMATSILLKPSVEISTLGTIFNPAVVTPVPTPLPPGTYSPDAPMPAPSIFTSITTGLVVNAQSGTTVNRLRITNSDGPCITVVNSNNVLFTDNDIGPCKEDGMKISNSVNISVVKSFIHDIVTGNAGVSAYVVDGITVSNNRFERNKSHVFIEDGKRIQVSFNTGLNVLGPPMPRGQMVQFSRASGGGNVIKCNWVLNRPGQSNPEDEINLYQSYGLASDPIQVIGNKIQGGGPSVSGGGILLGDDGGSDQIATDNVLVDPGQHGVSIASGQRISFLRTTILQRQSSFTNIGISIWNQYPTRPCGSLVVSGNKVNYVNSAGQPNNLWNAGNCGDVAGLNTNVLGAGIDPAIINAPIAACSN